MSGASSNTKEEFPQKRPHVAWGPSSAVAVTILSLFGSQFLAGFILAVVAAALSLSNVWLNSTAGQFYFVLLSDSFILLALWAFLRRRKAKFTDVGLSRLPVWKDAGYAILAYLAYFGVFIMLAIVAQTLTPIDLEQKQELGFDQLFGMTDRVLALISLVILPPIVEEIVFRGFMFTGLRKKLRFAGAALITSVAFAGLHLLGSSDGLLWIAALDTLVLSLALCYLREKTGALWAPMGLHAIKNAIAFFILLSGVAVL